MVRLGGSYAIKFLHPKFMTTISWQMLMLASGHYKTYAFLLICNKFIYCIHCTKRWKSIEIPNSYSLIETSRELKISNSDAIVNLNYVFELIKVIGRLAVLVAQLVECLLLTPEVRGSQSRHRQVFCYLHVVNCIEKTK